MKALRHSSTTASNATFGRNDGHVLRVGFLKSIDVMSNRLDMMSASLYILRCQQSLTLEGAMSFEEKNAWAYVRPLVIAVTAVVLSTVKVTAYRKGI